MQRARHPRCELVEEGESLPASVAWLFGGYDGGLTTYSYDSRICCRT